MEVRHLRRPFLAAAVEFLGHTLCGCPSHPCATSTRALAESEAPGQSCDFSPFRACLLATCLLAKPIRSTLDTKEGYKTKTWSTSSVTLTRIQYWDRVGGGKNIV